MDPIVTAPAGPQAVEVSPEAALILMALSQRGGECQIVNLLEYTSNVRRRNAKRPASLEFIIPDEIAKNVKGEPTEQDCLLLVHIPRVVFNEITDPSPIVAPDGGSTGPRRIIAP